MFLNNDCKLFYIKLYLPESYVIFLHSVVLILFKLNLTAFEADHVIVEHSLSETETLCEHQIVLVIRFKENIIKNISK